MKNLFPCSLLLLAYTSFAQTTIPTVALQLNSGIGISTKPETMFGAPFFLSADVAVTFNRRWQVDIEGGILGFRDLENPYTKIGFLFRSYSRYQHQYVGLRIGRMLLNTDQPQQLLISTGTDYLLIIEPNVKTVSGLLGGKYFDQLYKRFLNVPIQIDYSFRAFANTQTRLSINGRWNFNAYHSFPTISLGVVIPIYPLLNSSNLSR